MLSSIDKGIFPILAYSYYTYAISLREDDPYSALLYLEYSAAMSDLSIYFEKKKSESTLIEKIPKEYYMLLFLGFIIGASSMFLLTTLFGKKKKKRRKRKS